MSNRIIPIHCNMWSWQQSSSPNSGMMSKVCICAHSSYYSCIPFLPQLFQWIKNCKLLGQEYLFHYRYSAKHHTHWLSNNNTLGLNLVVNHFWLPVTTNLLDNEQNCFWQEQSLIGLEMSASPAVIFGCACFITNTGADCEFYNPPLDTVPFCYSLSSSSTENQGEVKTWRSSRRDTRAVLYHFSLPL